MREFKLGNHTFKFTPHKIMPVNTDYEVTKHYKIEVYSNSRLRSPKLIKTQNYMPSPAMTIIAFLDTLTKQRKKTA